MELFVSKTFGGTRVNLIDENNILIGFATDQSCCENFGWFIVESKDRLVSKINDILSDHEDGDHGSLSEKLVNMFVNKEKSSCLNGLMNELDLLRHGDLSDYVFDTNSFLSVFPENSFFGAAFCKMIHKRTKDEQWLCVYNEHNGYYYHGFKMNQITTLVDIDL